MSTEPARARLDVMAAASPEDYTRDPTRWGSAEVAAHFPGFAHLDVRTRGAVIRLRHGGSGPPLLLVHGNPQNHTCWYRIAARLARALPRHPARPARLRRQLAAGTGARARQLQLSRDGAGPAGDHGPAGLPRVLRGGPRPRGAHHAPHVHGPSRAHPQGMPDGHRAEPLRVDAHHQELGDRNLALGLHGAAGAVPGAADQRGAGGVLPEEPHGHPRRHGARLSHRGRARRVRALLHAEDDHGLVPRLSRVRDLRLRHGHRRQGQEDRHAASPPVGRARPSSGARARVRRYLAAVRDQHRGATSPCRAATTCRKRCRTRSTISTGSSSFNGK